MTAHPTGTREEWLAARTALLEREKELTRRSDELARERQALPWVPLEKEYVFESATGPRTLADLFDGRSQLMIYHFMYGPDWDEGCVSCSVSADHFDGPAVHLANHDVSFAAVSRAPIGTLDAYKRRMGWRFEWVSSLDSDFNFDFGVSFAPGQESPRYNFAPIDAPPPDELAGMSAFALQDGVVHHTYSCFSRGGDVLMGLYQVLDRAPLGRNEDDLDFPMGWMRRRDEY